MILRCVFIVALGLMGPGTAMAQSDGVTPVAQDDQEMNNAIAQAQVSLPLFFLNTMTDDGYGPDGGYLKVGFPVESSTISVENIWVAPFGTPNGHDFVGLLANEPVDMPGLQMHDQVSFTYDMIVDWSLPNAEGQIMGDFTTRVLIGRLPKSEAAAYANRFAEPAYPAAWEDAAN